MKSAEYIGPGVVIGLQQQTNTQTEGVCLCVCADEWKKKSRLSNNQEAQRAWPSINTHKHRIENKDSTKATHAHI